MKPGELKVALNLQPVADQLRGAAAAMYEAAEKIDPQDPQENPNGIWTVKSAFINHSNSVQIRNWLAEIDTRNVDEINITNSSGETVATYRKMQPLTEEHKPQVREEYEREITGRSKPRPDPQYHEYHLEYHLYAHPSDDPTIMLDFNAPGKTPGPTIGELVTRHGSWRENNIQEQRFVPADKMAQLLSSALAEHGCIDTLKEEIRNIRDELRKPPHYERVEP